MFSSLASLEATIININKHFNNFQHTTPNTTGNCDKNDQLTYFNFYHLNNIISI